MKHQTSKKLFASLEISPDHSALLSATLANLSTTGAEALIDLLQSDLPMAKNFIRLLALKQKAFAAGSPALAKKVFLREADFLRRIE